MIQINSIDEARKNEAWLRAKYLDEKLSIIEIARELSRSCRAIYTWFHKLGIPTRTRGEAFKCLYAREPWRNPQFGKPHTEEWKKQMRDRFLGANSPSWKGGESKGSNGYVYKRLADSKRVLKHRIIVEEILGRKLVDKEVVHHINGNPSDNRKENLKIFSSNKDHLGFHAKTRLERLSP